MPNVTARRFSWLLANDVSTVVAGPNDGVWIAQNGLDNWKQIPLTQSINAVVLSDDQLLLASDGCIWEVEQEYPPEVVFEPNGEPLWLTASAGRVWAGLRNGGLVCRDSPQATWRSLQPAFAGQSLLGLNAAVDGETLAAVTLEGGNLVNGWRSEDAGRQWQLVFSERFTPQAARIAVGADVMALAFGGVCFVRDGGEWQRERLSLDATPIQALRIVDGKLLALSADALHIYARSRWHSTRHTDETAFVAFNIDTADGSLIALEQTGRILKTSLNELVQ